MWHTLVVPVFKCAICVLSCYIKFSSSNKKSNYYSFQFNFIYEDLPKLVDVISHAIDVGYRHIDTAHLYRVEPEIGEVVNKKIKEGVVKREDLFITTKVSAITPLAVDEEILVSREMFRYLSDSSCWILLLEFNVSFKIEPLFV